MDDDEPQILAFPVQQSEDFSHLTDKETFYQLYLKAIRLINKINAGQYLPSKENIQAFYDINQHCPKYGFAPLDYDFTSSTWINVSNIGYTPKD